MIRKLFHIRAWGSDIYPDLDYEADVVDDIVRQSYPCLDIAFQYAIPHSAIMAGLKEQDDHLST